MGFIFSLLCFSPDVYIYIYILCVAVFISVRDIPNPERRVVFDGVCG